MTNGSTGRTNIQLLVLLVTSAFGIYLCYLMAAPFLPALAWALALAILFTPFQRSVESALRPGLAAGLSVLVIGMIVIIPATFVGQRLALQAAKGAELIETKITSTEWRRAIETRPRLAEAVDIVERYIDVPGAVRGVAAKLSSAAGPIVKASVYQVVGFCLTLYLLFFFLRDREAVLESIRSLAPLSESEIDRLFSRVSDTVYATVYGTLAVAAAQGLLGGLMFWWLGLPAPLIWGVTMALLAIVPMLGAFIVWVPAAVFLLLQGSWGKALILTLWGMLVVGTVDNLLRPILVGNRLKLHTILVFLSMVGGLSVFGASGVILGPVVLTVTIGLVEVWSGRPAAENVAREQLEELSRLEGEGGPSPPDVQ